MVDIKVSKNSKGLTYELANYAKSVNGGKAPKINIKQWERIMAIVTDINNKRPSDKAIFTGNTNLFGKANENFVIASDTIHFSDEEIALILKEMGIETTSNPKDGKFKESFNIKGLSIEHQSSNTNPTPAKESESQETSGNTGFELTNSQLTSPLPKIATTNRFLTFSNSVQSMGSDILETNSRKQVTSARDSINLTPPFEIKIPIPGSKGGGTKTISEAFHKRAMEIADKIGCTYEDLITVMNFESGISASEGSKNPRKKPVGLIQFTGSAINALNKTYGLHLTKEAVVKMSELEQLDLVEKYFMMTKQGNSRLKNKKTLDTADLYSLTILPNRAGRDILCKKNERNKDGKLLSYYESNRSLDITNDEVITRQDIITKLNEFRVNVKVV